MPLAAPLFTAVSSSARQLSLLLRCISFAKKAQVRISAEGLRFSTDEGSALEAFVFLDRSLFTSYTYNQPAPPSSQDDRPPPPTFEVSLNSLLETLHIFSLSDPAATKRPGGGDYSEAFAAHRLQRHAGIDAFSSRAMGMSGICTFSYDGEGTPLSIHMAEVGVTTTCDLTTYEAPHAEEIPFNRDAIALKTIMRSSYLLDATSELGAFNPATLTIVASPATGHARSRSTNHAELSISASGALGSATVDFTTATASETPILETFQCATRTRASFNFAMWKHAQRAMGAATKVSLRLDEEGVLSLQFLVEVDGGGGGSAGAAADAGPQDGPAVAFVDFRIVPLVEGEADGEDGARTDSESE